MELPSHERHDEGFTLIEVIAAMVVLAILASAVALALGQSLQASRTSRQRVAAANLISGQMDLIRDASYSRLALGTSNLAPVNIDGTSYSLVQDVRISSGTSATTDSCSGTGTTAYKKVTITATWPNMLGTAPVRSDTVISPDVGDVSTNNITIPIRVRDSGNNPEPGVAVQLTGTGVSTSLITDAYGCVIFSNLAPAQYTATTASTSSPFQVNWQGSSTNTVTVGSTTGGSWLPTTEFQWDTAAALTLTPKAPDALHPVPAGVGATVANTSLATPGYLTLPSAGTSVTASRLFPFSNGYQYWAGTCADADPQATGGSRMSPAQTQPGGSLAYTPTTRAVDVKVSFAGGVPNGVYTLQAVHAADSGTGCTSGTTLTLGTLSKNGTISVGMPYGTWTFSIAGRTGSALQTVSATSTSAIKVNVSAS